LRNRACDLIPKIRSGHSATEAGEQLNAINAVVESSEERMEKLRSAIVQEDGGGDNPIVR
jgi:hypothetical protein